MGFFDALDKKMRENRAKAIAAGWGEDEDYVECPECDALMKSGYGSKWVCTECGLEAEYDDYGNLVY